MEKNFFRFRHLFDYEPYLAGEDASAIEPRSSGHDSVHSLSLESGGLAWILSRNLT